MKKVRLKAHSDVKIFREVNALSRLSHRFIVRYYTTWLETSERTEPISTAVSDADSDSERSSMSGQTSVPASFVGSNISFKLYDDLDEMELGSSASRGSFPSIHFRRASTSSGEEEDTDSDGDLVEFRSVTPELVPQLQRTLYIQMVCHRDIDVCILTHIQEFVERQTLKEARIV